MRMWSGQTRLLKTCRILLCFGAPALLFTGCAREEPPRQVIMRIGHPMAPGNNVTLGYEKFKQLVEQRSGGRIIIKLYPDAFLGNDLVTMKAAQAGELEMASSSTPNLADISEIFMAFDVPYITAPENQKKLYAALDEGELGRYLENRAATMGLKPVMWSEYGYRNFATVNRRLRLPADLAGLRLRTTQSPVDIAVVRALGATPVSLIWADTFPALLRGSIDGEGNTYDLLHAAQHQEVLRFIAQTQHNYSMHVLMMNLAYWRRLPGDFKAVIAGAAKNALEYERSITEQNEQAAKKKLQEAGLTITTLSREELHAWREALRPVAENFTRQADPELVRLIRQTQQ